MQPTGMFFWFILLFSHAHAKRYPSDWTCLSKEGIGEFNMSSMIESIVLFSVLFVVMFSCMIWIAVAITEAIITSPMVLDSTTGTYSSDAIFDLPPEPASLGRGFGEGNFFLLLTCPFGFFISISNGVVVFFQAVEFLWLDNTILLNILAASPFFEALFSSSTAKASANIWKKNKLYERSAAIH